MRVTLSLVSLLALGLTAGAIAARVTPETSNLDLGLHEIPSELGLEAAVDAAVDAVADADANTAPVPFSYSNCDATAAIQVKALSVTDPIPLGGKATISAEGVVSRDVSAPVSTTLSLKKEAFGSYIEVPCITVSGKKVGSCTYDDICSMIPPSPPGTPCPAPLGPAGIPCSCPIAAGDYTLPPFTQDLPIPKDLPKELGEGNYKVAVSQKDAVGAVSCVQLEFSVTKTGNLYVPPKEEADVEAAA